MNKISKKIVALATMAAFVLTLVPAAAFAANEGTGRGDVSYKASGIVSSSTEVKAGDQIKATLLVQDESGVGTSEDLSTPDKVKIWAVDQNNTAEFTDAVDFVTDNNGNITQCSGNQYVYRFVNDADNNTDFYLTFKRPGTYTIYMGVGDFNNDVQTQTKIDGVFANGFQQLGKTLTVTVGEADVTTARIELTKDNGAIGTVNKTNPTATLNLTKEDFKFNNTDEFTIHGTAYQADGSLAAYDSFNVSTNKEGIINIISDNPVTTKNDGTFDVTFTMKDTQNGYIYLTNDDVSYSIYLIGQTVEATTITTVEDGGYVLAGTDSEWLSNQPDARYFNDAVQFELKDAKGNILTGDDILGDELAAGEDGPAVKDTVINITSKPGKSTLSSTDLQLVWYEGVYTLFYRPASGDQAKDLVPGEYKVTVALNSDSSADATFKVDEFGTVKDLALSMVASDYNGSHEVAVSDEVTLGQLVKATVKYVDEKGLKINAPAGVVQYGFDGKAINNKAENDGQFWTKRDTITNEALLGTTIEVKAFVPGVKLVETQLTVVDSYNTYSLAFDENNGEINNDNPVVVSVVDKDGNVAKTLNADKVYATVEDQSNADAKVTAEVIQTVEDGKAKLNLYADQETTADILVVVVTKDEKIYAGTLEYAFGAEDLLADRSVVMTIGSTEYVVNNNIISGDAAPYVDSAWRTMVPVRALAESFGATVDYKDNVITIVDGDTEVVMNIGEETYTLNDVEKTMDTAPVIGEGDRAYVPIRFAAEALGYTVTPLYGNDGLTASVVFQR